MYEQNMLSFPTTYQDVEEVEDPIFGEPKWGNFDDYDNISLPLFNNGLLRNLQCCVPNCQDLSSPRHRFPKNDPCRTLLWINKINSKLLDIGMNKILKSCVVCHTHFRKEFKVGKNSLTLNAVPTLHLPESEVETEDLHITESHNEIQADYNKISEEINLRTPNESAEETKMEYIVITEMDHQESGTFKEFDMNIEMVASFIAAAAKVLKPLNISEGSFGSNFNIPTKEEELAVKAKRDDEERKILNAKKYLKYMRPYECKICDYKTVQARHLTHHLKTHEEKKFKCKSAAKLFACQLCDYKTTQKKVLKEHLRTHTKGNLFMCTFCDYTSKRRVNLKIHLRTHTGEKPYMCEFCGKRFTQTYNLKEHQRIHTGDKPYLCQYCNYRTTHKVMLKRHLITHTGEKPCMCNICGYRTSRTILLRYHMRKHTGEKPYMCKVCGYRASRKNRVTTHYKIHTGVKDFACNLCDYKCRNGNRLKEHIRTHTGEKPFACSICDFSSAIKSNLQSHFSLHTKENFKCKMCNYNTSHKRYFANHLKRHHKM